MANVIVTGGSRGIGLATVRALAANDYTVIAIARQQTDELAAAAEEASNSVYFLPFDLERVDEIHELVRSLRERDRGEHLHRFGPLNTAA